MKMCPLPICIGQSSSKGIDDIAIFRSKRSQIVIKYWGLPHRAVATSVEGGFT